MRWASLPIFCALTISLSIHAHAADQPFVVHVVDEETGRGVPLVEFRTFSESRFFTDSNGVIALTDPWLYDRNVYFRVRSPGYEFPRVAPYDPPWRGTVLRVVRGGRVTLTVRRINIAERLYRITGEGIYRDSVLAGVPTPIRDPLLNGGVTGQDTAVATPFQGKIYWIWGDTFGLDKALFAVSGGISENPATGGLNPAVGVDLTYFVDASGFSKAMLPISRNGLVWIEGMLTTRDQEGTERLVATYTRQAGLRPPDERGVAVFDEQIQQFRVLQNQAGGRHHYSSHPFRTEIGGKAYWYLYPHQRVLDDWLTIQDSKAWESYTCLASGATFVSEDPRLDWTTDGTLRCGWKANTDRIDAQEERSLISKGLLPEKHALFLLRDSESGAPTGARPGSVAWNAYRRKWIMIAASTGDIYYSEAGAPEGPWNLALRIATHGDYNFYNPVHHSFFDQDGGKTIYFEGTYTNTFSKAREITPLYNYNQIMYRLKLDDSRIVRAFGTIGGR